MIEIKTNLGQAEEYELKTFKNKLKKIKKDLGISRNTKLKDDNIIKRKEELMILSRIINQTILYSLSINWFCEEDSDYIYDELSNISERISKVDSSLTDIYTTIMKSIDNNCALKQN